MPDPAMIQWPFNTEYYRPPNAPAQPVGLPPSVRISADPINAFNSGVPQPLPLPRPTMVNSPPPMSADPINSFNSGTPQFTSAPSYGPMQDLALQMAGYGAPSGYRAAQTMAPVSTVPGGIAPGGYDGSSPNPGDPRPPGPLNPLDNNPVPPIGVGGGNSIPNNQGWINDILDNATGYFPPGATIDLSGLSNPFANGDWESALSAAGRAIMATGNPVAGLAGGLYGLWSSAQNAQTPSGPVTYAPPTNAPPPNPINDIFGPPPDNPNAPPSGPSTPVVGGSTSGGYTGHPLRRPIPITSRSKPGHLGEDQGR